MTSVIVFGAGMVARPLVDYLLEHGARVTVASRTVARAEELVRGHTLGKAVAFDIERGADDLTSMVAEHDVAVSLLPYTHHVRIAEACIAAGTNMVTTSYVSPAMRELDPKVAAAGITILNEIGLDPGIDHMSAMRIIHDVKGRGGKITSFTSFCGGLPAPEANDNPFGYKFSWSPLGVVMAGRNGAKYLENGKNVEIEPADLFASVRKVAVEGIGELDAYPNRDSMPYVDIYGIQGAGTMLRGTLRYPGWCSTWKAFSDLGMLDDGEMDVSGLTWAGYMHRLAGCSDCDDARKCVAAKLGLEPDSDILERMEWLGLFSQDPLPAGIMVPMKLLAARLEEKLQYRSGERDMVILKHEFQAEFPDGSREHITSTLIDYGIPGGSSAMSRTVGLPAAIGCRMIAEGKIDMKGVRVPVRPEIYVPILDELERLGIKCVERSEDME